MTSDRARPADEATQVLRSAIEARGLTASRLSAQQAWAVFLDFATVPFDVPDQPDSDGLLYQWGLFDVEGEPAFCLDLVRQLARHDDDEHVQIHLEMRFPPAPDLVGLGEHDQWWFADSGIALDDWAQTVSRRPEWRSLSRLTPTRVDIYQDET